jgi:tetratricopeptide (TPR) repeat protein
MSAATLSTVSLLDLRALFRGRYEHAPCLACQEPLPFEPSVMVSALEPPVAWISGGDTLSAPMLSSVADELRRKAESEGHPLALHQFQRQAELRESLFAHLRTVARAMTPLNAANAAGTLVEFMMREWRTITPDAIVASDVITMVQKVGGANTPEEHAAAIEYFEQHASSLAYLQFLSWLGLCTEHGSGAVQVGTTLQQDLARYIIRGAIFEDAPKRLVEHVREYVGSKETTFIERYVLLAAAAFVHHKAGRENPLAADWTAEWASFELVAFDEDPAAAGAIESLRLDPKVVAASIDRRTLHDAAGQLLQDHLGKPGAGAQSVFAQINAIGERAGYAGLLSDLYGHVRITGSVFDTADKVMEALLGTIEKGHVSKSESDTQLSLSNALSLFATTLLIAKDVAALTSVFERTRALAEDDTTRAKLDAWFGARLVELQREHVLLEYIGGETREWEEALENSVKGSLWTERANALRAAGQRQQNLALRERIVPLYEADAGSNDHRTAIRNLAIAHREMGAPDRALELLEPLLEDVRALDRLAMLETAAATYAALGELADAAAALDEAITLAVGPHAGRRAQFQAARTALLRGSTHDQTEQRLLASSRDDWSNPVTLMQECAAWVNLLVSDHKLSPEGEQRLSDVLITLGKRLVDDAANFPPHIREAGFMIAARALELIGSPEAVGYWGSAADAADAIGNTPHPLVVLALAGNAYREGRTQDARLILIALPDAMARGLERLERIDIALGALTNLGQRFDELSEFLLDAGLGHDARVLAEFRRDAVRRSGVPRESDESREMMSGVPLARVLAGENAAVLEFLETVEGIVAMLTWRPPGQKLRFTLLDWPQDADLMELRDRVLYKLQSWTRARPGDPFDVKDWPAFKEWIRGALDEVLPADGHLIVIEHETLAGLPFHAAIAPERSCSYASSWSMLDQAMRRAAEQPKTVGCALVPAFSDDQLVVTAMQSAHDACAASAARHDVQFSAAIGTKCDRRALTALLDQADLLFIACHGFVDEESHEIAWVLSHGGGLPGTTGVVVSGDDERITHFGWRDIEDVARTPALVLSAACSSGRSAMAGLGERLGLFPSLAGRGTRTLIAPAWDVDADLVMPVATRTFELLLDGRHSPASAVRTACAESSSPQWIAWSLTLEGSWQ